LEFALFLNIKTVRKDSEIFLEITLTFCSHGERMVFFQWKFCSW